MVDLIEDRNIFPREEFFDTTEVIANPIRVPELLQVSRKMNRAGCHVVNYMHIDVLLLSKHLYQMASDKTKATGNQDRFCESSTHTIYAPKWIILITVTLNHCDGACAL